LHSFLGFGLAVHSFSGFGLANFVRSIENE
jgi:hypothetical protein